MTRILAALAALAMGAGIAWIDTRPNWDDTGVTVGLLLVAVAIAAALGLRWWQAAPVVAGPLLLAERPGAAWEIALILALAGAGGVAGTTLRGVVERTRRE